MLIGFENLLFPLIICFSQRVVGFIAVNFYIERDGKKREKIKIKH